MSKRDLLTTAMMVALASRATGQSQWLGRPAVPADSVPRSVLQAEARGSRHPLATANNEGASATNTSISGTRERRCVETDSNAVRSGDFVAGPFAYYNDIWRSGQGKLWWHPSEMIPKPPLLIVQVTRLDQEGESRVFESSDIAWPSGPEATSIKFYPTGFRLPSVGRWMMVATAGNSWGCFVHTIR